LNLINIVSTTKWIGMVLIVLCWIQVIPLRIGWLGFGIALVSFIVETIYKKKLTPPAIEGSSGEQSEANNQDNNNS